MTAIAITGINSYFAISVLPRLERDPDIERILGIDGVPSASVRRLKILDRIRNPHPMGYGWGQGDWLSRSRMGMAEKAAHCYPRYPYVELLPQHRSVRRKQ